MSDIVFDGLLDNNYSIDKMQLDLDDNFIRELLSPDITKHSSGEDVKIHSQGEPFEYLNGLIHDDNEFISSSPRLETLEYMNPEDHLVYDEGSKTFEFITTKFSQTRSSNSSPLDSPYSSNEVSNCSNSSISSYEEFQPANTFDQQVHLKIAPISLNRNGNRYQTSDHYRTAADRQEKPPNACPPRRLVPLLLDVNPIHQASRSQVPNSLTNNARENNINDSFWKKEQRKIRNREAAQNSRKKKKELHEKTQTQLTHQIKLNSELIKENDHLRNLVLELRKEVSVLRTHIEKSEQYKNSPPQRQNFRKTAKAVCALGIVFFFTINIGSVFNRFLPLNDKSGIFYEEMGELNQASVGPLHKGGRLLRAKRSPENISDPLLLSYNLNTSNPLNNNTLLEDCQKRIYANQTELLRLNKELTSWMERHQRLWGSDMSRAFSKLYPKNTDLIDLLLKSNTLHKLIIPDSKEKGKDISKQNNKGHFKNSKKRRVERKTESSRARKSDIPESKKAFKDKSSLKAKMNNELITAHSDLLSLTKGATNPDFQLSRQLQILANMHKRDDTLYLVSLKDYLLLPAVSQNITLGRPRMSFVFPDLWTSTNGTRPLTLMKIECEVTSTGVFQMPPKIAETPN